MAKERVGRLWFALTALVVAVGIVIQLYATATVALSGGFFRGAAERTLNVFAYFTIQSNLLLGATCLVLAIRTDRTSTLFRALRLDGVLGITVTGIVYHLVLAAENHLTGIHQVANLLLHTAAPLLGFLGWLLFGPRGGMTWRIVGWSVVWPVAWLVFTLVRGAIVGFYPYPFLDVPEHGYPTVLLNSLLVAVLFFALAGALALADRRLAARR